MNITDLSLSSYTTTCSVRLGRRVTTSASADPDPSVVGSLLPEAQVEDNEDDFEPFSPLTHDWSSDYIWVEEQAMRQLDEPDDDTVEFQEERALRAAEQKFEPDEDDDACIDEDDH